MVTHRYHRIGVLVLAGALALLPSVAVAHGFWQTGDPNDIWGDLILNLALPVVVILGGAGVGLGLARWLARHQPPDAPDESANG